MDEYILAWLPWDGLYTLQAHEIDLIDESSQCPFFFLIVLCIFKYDLTI